MKFGGSSVAGPERIRRVAERVIQRRRQGHDVVTVVSAPGDMTDDLLTLAQGVCDDPDGRELDMLLATGEQVSIALLTMAVKHRGMEAISLTGPQAGILADTQHTQARIIRVEPAAIRRQLAHHRVVIVAGFQGLNPHSDITTLGRGGSDLTAVALAAALQADRCEVYTDVKGVYTTDPRVVPSARKIGRISYDEMLELAGSGAQVMQARSIEVAKKFHIPVYVQSAFSGEAGTLITTLKEGSRMEDVVVTGVSFDRNQARVSMVGVPDRPGVAANIFGALADAGVNVDMIIQSAASNGANDISFTIARNNVPKALRTLAPVRRSLGAARVAADEGIAKVSVVGVGMRSHPGVAARMFQALARAGVNIEMISTSEIKISCAVRERQIERAVQVLHRAFQLAKAPRPAHP